jgi:hypothetical protein
VFLRSVSLVALYVRLCLLVWSVLSRSFPSYSCPTPTCIDPPVVTNLVEIIAFVWRNIIIYHICFLKIGLFKIKIIFLCKYKILVRALKHGVSEHYAILYTLLRSRLATTKKR